MGQMMTPKCVVNTGYNSVIIQTFSVVLGGNGGVLGVATGSCFFFAGTGGGVSKLNSSVVTSTEGLIIERVVWL